MARQADEVMQEPGSVDNRMSINPNDDRWPFVAEWEDGAVYTVQVRIRQLSPGEFEVLSMKESRKSSQEEEYGGASAEAREMAGSAANSASGRTRKLSPPVAEVLRGK